MNELIVMNAWEPHKSPDPPTWGDGASAASEPMKRTALLGKRKQSEMNAQPPLAVASPLRSTMRIESKRLIGTPNRLDIAPVRQASRRCNWKEMSESGTSFQG